MKDTNKHRILKALLLAGTALMIVGCQTARTGGKVVDKTKGEVVLSSPGDQRTAIPEGSKDSSLTKARSKSEELAKESPKDIATLLGLAQLQLAQSRFTESEETCRKVLLLDIKNQDARKVLAQIALRRDNYEMALIFLNAIGGDGSKDSDVHNMLGLIALARGNNGEAMSRWKAALTLNSGDISARMNMGVMYLKNRLLQQASTQFERIIKIAPNHQDALLHLAIIDASRGKHEAAMAVYQSILDKDPTNPLALYNLAVSQKSLSRYDDAVASLKKYVKSSPQKTASTDQAFALIDEIHGAQEAQGQKIDDSELQTMAAELSTRKADTKIDQSAPAAKPANITSEQPNKKSIPAVAAKSQQNKIEPQPAIEAQDQEIEALEKQLRSPSH